jgi:hypothetical protein
MKNRCPDPDQIQEFLDNNLGETERKSFAAHLQGCKICREQMNMMEKVYTSAQKYAVEKLSRQAQAGEVNSLMSRLQPAEKEAKADGLNFFASLFSYKWLLPAMAIILLLVFSKQPAPEKALPPPQTFSLATNRAEVVLASPQSRITVEKTPVKTDDFTAIPTEKEIALPDNMLILVTSSNFVGRFSRRAIFSLSQKQIVLQNGRAEFSLSGSHPGFAVITPCAEVIPLGTEFMIETGADFSKIQLQNGSLEIISKSGIKRLMNQPGRLYVSSNGQFSADFPHLEAKPGEASVPSNSSGSSGTATGSGSETNSRLIDSF